ncbi:IS110 family RNA-guided transposase [Lacicoccus qingdaonensis]|uniref:Transposase n=5 Tax=Lacicoccus qingdaonensis TaxID=576118 RepID=A0A1G9JLR9_9BACL|nr:IS110 family transposase [Salinicoccus qingdaonensis]SDL38428.1 Transposase [Salinicoccus qingdaonensis]
MFYLGIDIGKRNHEVGLINHSGDPVGKTLSFKNTKAGSDQLLKFINQHQLTPDDVAVGMEATGHYWLSVFSFLKHLDFKITVFNPMQSDALRHFYIRKTKTDIRDAYLIAQVIRMDAPEETPFIEEDLMRLRQLERFRYGIVDQVSDIKRKVIAVLDQVFPEYDQVFSDIFGKSSKQLLLQSPLPEDLLDVDTDTLADLLNQVSQQRLGRLRATQKVEQVKQLATDTFGIALGTDVFKLQIQLMIEQIQLLEQQLKTVEENMIELSRAQDHYLTTITGISDVTASVILGEVGDFERFERPEQLVAFAGLDASVHQSGDFTSARTKLSKRGSPYLRRAIWQAAFVASNQDPALTAYYQKLRNRGKVHGTAVGAVARKLTHIIFAIMRDKKPYKPH